jgi:phage terminase small subunit
MKRVPRGARNRWRKFAEYYIIDFNGVNAYLNCGCYVETTRIDAGKRAATLLAKPEVQEMIQEEVEARSKRMSVSQDTVVLEQMRIAMADVTNYVSWSEKGIVTKPSDELSEDESRAIESIDCYQAFDSDGNVVGTTRVKIKLYNKASALESLAKHLGMYTEKREVYHYGTIQVPALASDDEWNEIVKQQTGHLNGSHTGTDENDMETE